jgi:DNA-binding MarR family transcriptional regulator
MWLKCGLVARDERRSDEEILREIALAPDPVVTAPELAERLDYSRQGVNNRLKTLVEDGYVRRKDVGARAAVYWLSERGRKEIGAV